MRNLLYDAGILESRGMPIPVISVGGLTTGGSGKTPVSAAVAGWLVEGGRRPAVITGGIPDEAAVHRTGKILIVHEDNEFAGFGAEVAAQIADKSFEWLDAPVRRYAAPEVPAFPFAAALEAQVMPNVEGIVERARELAEF